MAREEHDTRLRECFDEPVPVRKSDAGELDALESAASDDAPDAKWLDDDLRLFGDSRDEFLYDSIANALARHTSELLDVIRRERENTIACFDRKLARLEGELSAMRQIFAVRANEFGSLRGERGERGEIGPRGLVGVPGRPGKDAPVLSSLIFDAHTLSLIPRLSDGSKAAPIRLDAIFAGIEIDREAYAVVVKLVDGSEMRLDVRPLFEQFFHETDDACRT